MKTLILVTAALATVIATPAAADPKKGNKGRGHEQSQHWDRDDRGRGNGRAIPPGHMPPPGACRVWIEGRPPGHQPSVTSCRQAQRDAYRYGGRVIRGGRR